MDTQKFDTNCKDSPTGLSTRVSLYLDPLSLIFNLTLKFFYSGQSGQASGCRGSGDGHAARDGSRPTQVGRGLEGGRRFDVQHGEGTGHKDNYFSVAMCSNSLLDS
jgi:hypothetical protein